MEFTMRASGWTDWRSERERIDLAEVMTRLLGPPPGRRGERSGRLWWVCPFHEDHNPSLCMKPGARQWRCFGCGAKGDAVALARRLDPGLTFPDAVRLVTGRAGPSAAPRTRPTPVASPRAKAEAPAEGMTPGDALALVDASAARLWGPEGADALAYLTGPARGLAPETIRAARLGWTPGASARTRDGRTYTARGIVIPWFDRDALTLVKVRQPEGRRPKYSELFRDPDRPPRIYPGPEAIRPGRPLIIVEGEFDALLLRQALGEPASVVTLGSASARPDPGILGAMLSAWPRFVATDADPAGETSAAGWPASARRIRPPGPNKDWTEAHQAGVDLPRWWGDVLAGNATPPLFTWPDLAAWRWGQALAEGPESAADPDAYALAERLAIEAE